MNRWKPVIAGCCREPVFWAALLLAGFGIWIYGYEAAPVAPSETQARAAAGRAADSAATADTAADGPAPLARRESGGASGNGAGARSDGDDADDDSIGGNADALPRRWIREADVLVHRGDELILDAGLPAKFLDRVPLHLEDIHQALEDAGRRLRDNDISGEEQ